MSELKPCPFCGGEAELTGFDAPEFWVWCPNCKASTDAHTCKGGAIEAWNTRAPMSYEDLKILLDELGVSERTCRMTDRGECSECGAYIVRAWTEVHDFNGDMKRIDLRSHNYCPNCGAKVVSE